MYTELSATKSDKLCPFMLSATDVTVPPHIKIAYSRQSSLPCSYYRKFESILAGIGRFGRDVTLLKGVNVAAPCCPNVVIADGPG